MLPGQMIYFILNQLNWDNFGDELIPPPQAPARDIFGEMTAALGLNVLVGCPRAGPSTMMP